MALNASQRLATGKSTEGMLQLKEKLAQSLINIAEKDREIAELREECDKQCEANSQLEEVVASLKEELQETGKTIEETKSAYADLVSQHEQCHLQVESNSIDQGLLLKQIQFYKQEIDVLK